MSKSSVGGRGRGWLNLNKNQHVSGNNVGPQYDNVSNNLHSPLMDENQFVDAPEYSDIISRVKELDVNDDGIKFNQKIRYIIENWKEDCPTSEEVEKSFDNLYEASLNDEELASKLVIMISSRSFETQKIHETKIRSLFISKLQNNFEGRKLLHKNNPVAFRNSVRILGEFFNKARLASGAVFPIFVAPVISYLEMLLESASSEDLQLFTTQLFLNGSSIKSKSTDKLVELLNNARLLLVSNEQLSKESKLWLLLSIDVSSSRFGLLPGELHKFYLEHMGDLAMANFQGTPATLSVQTQDNKNLESFKSNVNVLQLSNKLESSTIDQTSQLSNSEINNSSLGFSSSSGFVPDSSTQNSSINRRESSQNPGKHGRPILGAGARLIKNKTSNDSNWKDRDNSRGWSNKHKGNDWGDKKSSKGWEHDDRFENDYS